MAYNGVKSGRWRLRPTERRALLILGDMVCGLLAGVLALNLWARLDYLGPEDLMTFVRARAPWFVLLPPIWVILLHLFVDFRQALDLRGNFRAVLVALAAATGLYLVLYFSVEGSLPRRGVLYFLGLAAASTLGWRVLYTRLVSTPAFTRRALIVGAGKNGCTMLKLLKDISPPPFDVLGLIDDDPAKHGQMIEDTPVLGGSEVLLETAFQEEVSDIIVAILGPMEGEMFQALLDAQERGLDITRMPVAYEELLGRVPILYLESDWLLRSFVDELRVGSFYLLLKRLVDLAGAFVGLLILALVLPPAALAIMIESGRPIFHQQERLGQGGYRFKIYKLRTMIQDAEAEGRPVWAREDDPRKTRVGHILRRTHLDEFPQFWNVLRGEMSLVGPRPERPEFVAELEQEIPFYRARLLVPPGIGGWAQVNYGYGSTTQDAALKLEYDLYYIKHRGLMFDFWIVLRTFGQTIGLKGV